MVRLLIFLAALALAAFGLTWLANNPGVVDLTWRGEQYEVSLMFGLAAVVALAIAIAIVWGVLRFVFRVPSLVSIGAQARKREKGFRALSRGMLAVGAGDARAAAKHALDASRLIGHEPMTKLLQAQSAQLAGDTPRAVAAYTAMLEHHETHGLGLRGLHLEARRAGDHSAALQYAMRANARAPAAWAGQAVLDDRTRRGDWAGALATVDSNAAARLIDKPTANRWRAVIKTAMAEAAMERDPKAALALAQEACKLAPTLVPAAAISGRLTAQAGDLRRASRMLEAAYAQTPHPDLAAAYLRVRHGDSSEDRLAPRPDARPREQPQRSRVASHGGARGAGSARIVRRARGDRSAHRLGFAQRPTDPSRLLADGRHRGGGGQSRRGARVARSRCPRPARQGLGGGWGHQRPLGAGLAVGNARRVRLAHA